MRTISFRIDCQTDVMISTSARLLKLLSLLQTPREWTGPQLAARLEVSTRTVRSDVERLRDLGYPVAGTPGAAGGYRLQPGSEMPPLLLDDEEAVVVALGLQAAATGVLAGAEEVALRALTKIAQTLPHRLRHRVQTMQQAATIVPRRGPRVDTEVLERVARACREHEGLRFDYGSADGATSRRRAEPHHLVHRAGRWYLLAYDLDRSDWRTFRLDRMRLRVPGGARFVAREVPGGDPGAFVDARITTITRRYTATFRLHIGRDELMTWFDPSWGVVESEGEDRCLLHTANDSYESTALGVGLSGLEFEVLEPPELRDQLRSMAARLARAAGS